MFILEEKTGTQGGIELQSYIADLIELLVYTNFSTNIIQCIDTFLDSIQLIKNSIDFFAAYVYHIDDLAIDVTASILSL